MIFITCYFNLEQNFGLFLLGAPANVLRLRGPTEAPTVPVAGRECGHGLAVSTQFLGVILGDYNWVWPFGYLDIFPYGDHKDSLS